MQFFENSYDSKHSCVPVMDIPNEEEASIPKWRLFDILYIIWLELIHLDFLTEY